MEDGDERGGGGGFVAGVFFGLLTGAGLALIAAPTTGTQTRDRLRAGAREANERTRNTVDQATQSVRDQATDLIERGREIVEAARARVNASIAEGKDAAERQRIELEHRT